MSEQKLQGEQISLNSLQRIFSRSPNILISAANPLDSCSRTTKIDVVPRSPVISSPGQRFILPKVGVSQLGLVESLYSDEQDQQGIIFSVQSPDFILSSSSSERKPRCAVPTTSTNSQSVTPERSGQQSTCCVCSAVTGDCEDVFEASTELGSNSPLVDGLTDTSSQSVPIIVTISIGVCATLLLLLSVVLITCLVHKRRQKRTTSSRSFSSDNSKPSVQDGFSGSQGTSCYNDTMSEETMSYISERSGSFISPQDNGLRGANGVPNIHMMVSLYLYSNSLSLCIFISTSGNIFSFY